MLGVFAAAIAFAIAGCGGSDSSAGGGGGGGFTGFTKTPMTAQLTLPTGSKAEPMTSLKLWTSGGQVTPDATGKGEVVIFNNGPQFTQAYDSQGRMVAAGFVGEGRAALNMDSTAQALVFFAVGGPLQKGKTSALTVLNGVKTMPGYPAVVSAVTGSLTTQGFISAEDPAVKTALNNVVQAVLSGGKSRGPDISPTTSASGLDLNDDVDDQVQITNNFFRRSYAFLELTGFKDDLGNTVALNKELSQSWINMPGRYNGNVDSATGLIKGQYQWQPVATDPFKVPASIAESDKEVEVYYTLTTVGAGRTGGDFDKMSTAQFVKWEETVFWTIYLDFFVQVFANLIVPLDGEALDSFTEFALKNDKAKQMISGLRSSMPDITSLTAQGKFPLAVASFVGSSQIESNIVPVTGEVFTAWAETKGHGLFTDQGDIVNRVGIASKRVGMISLASATERMAPLADLEQSDLVNVFEITSSRATVSLVPDRTEVGINSTTDINAVIRNKQEGAPYVYEWSVSPNDSAFLQDVKGGSTDESAGGILKTSESEVFIGNLTHNPLTTTVTCRVTLNNQVVGNANTRIQFKTNVVKGTGTLKVLSRIGYPTGTEFPYNSYGSTVLCVIEIPKVQDAVHYGLVIEDKEGDDVERANWAANQPPRVGDSKLWENKPDDVYWYLFDGLTTPYLSSEEAALEKMNEDVERLTKKHDGVKAVVTAYTE